MGNPAGVLKKKREKRRKKYEDRIIKKVLAKVQEAKK